MCLSMVLPSLVTIPYVCRTAVVAKERNAFLKSHPEITEHHLAQLRYDRRRMLSCGYSRVHHNHITPQIASHNIIATIIITIILFPSLTAQPTCCVGIQEAAQPQVQRGECRSVPLPIAVVFLLIVLHVCLGLNVCLSVLLLVF